MNLSQKDFEKLHRMQGLCTALEIDLAHARDFMKRLKVMDKRIAELESLYQEDWMRLTENLELTATQQGDLESMIPEGRHSILGQDTIWNALTDVRCAYIKLLKFVAKRIR